MGMLNCEVCGVHVSKKQLYRVNEKGVPAIVRCKACMEKPPDPIVKDICETIAGKPDEEDNRG